MKARDNNEMQVLRETMASFSPASKVEPNEPVGPDRVFTPESHRSVLDLGRQLVVGNRGMGKSLWTHALTDTAVRSRVADIYGQPQLKKSKVVIGFNGAEKTDPIAPTPDSIERALGGGYTAEDIWRAVIFRAVQEIRSAVEPLQFDKTLAKLKKSPGEFEDALSSVDDDLAKKGTGVLILFDALDRLPGDWQRIRQLTTALLRRAVGLKSFKSIRTKIFIRPDQFSDRSIFQFPDGSKILNDHVDLSWQPHELFGLLFFEIMRGPAGKTALTSVARRINASDALGPMAKQSSGALEDQRNLIKEIAGPYMGTDARRGRVYTWVPLHLSDARNACSPRTFLTAWQKASEHKPVPSDRAVDHLGLIEGVRKASSTRLAELREDYRWIDSALAALKGQFVPIERRELLRIWEDSEVVQGILGEARAGHWLAPVQLADEKNTEALLDAMNSIAVTEERANGKINVPDIFRVEAGIKRKGGVAVPRRT
ncbi:hypothetical protein [Shinella fusca]|uniref:Uncharacterized protein n=1 Tax=Shinella fusca TaxID=544480 RepID=A0A7W7YZ59_9HYPH|nr:hypothetical protein [Shinella fusca]MBB5045001.1 hypothetical protein [Shinella fusca]